MKPIKPPLAQINSNPRVLQKLIQPPICPALILPWPILRVAVIIPLGSGIHQALLLNQATIGADFDSVLHVPHAFVPFFAIRALL